MKRRPLLIWILAIFHLLEPLIKTILLSIAESQTIGEVIKQSSSLGFQHTLQYWALFPIGGVALLLMRNWSFWIFIGVQLYNIVALAVTESHSLVQASRNPYQASLILVFANAVFIFYVFAPNIRDLFFHSSLRRWEMRERHKLKIPCSLKVHDKHEHLESEILNISETGVFIKAPLEISREHPLVLHFNFYNLHFKLKGEIVSAHESQGVKGLGIHFQFADMSERLHLKKLIKVLEMLGL